MDQSKQESWIRLGRVVRAHGIKGGLSVKLDNPHSVTLKRNLIVRVELSAKPAAEYKVVGFQGGRILYLEGLSDRDTAQSLQKAQIFVKRGDLPELEDGWEYLSDLVGFEVFDQENRLLGIVEGFSDNTAQTLIVVRLANKKEGLIPFVKEIVESVEHATSSIRVNLPQGLLETE